MRHTLFKLTATLSTLALLTGCSSHSIETRVETAAGIAQGAGLARQDIVAGAFKLATWQKTLKPGTTARIYIEGDGLAWLTENRISPNPTPVNPMGLKLATADSTDNVIYIARPCQYSGMADGSVCSDTYWTSGRTAPEVIATYQALLDQLKAAHGLTGFELVGYSGGASVAALVAAGRTDVINLRTVAGNTDYAAFTALHEVSPLSSSIDPVSVASALKNLPQMHFIGGSDEIVPLAIFAGWKEASGPSLCVKSNVIAGNGHDKGWAESWASLLTVPLTCTLKIQP